MNIGARNLAFGYPDFRLSVEELVFESSKIACIVGPNGAGKSTLLKCLAAVLPIPRGSVFLDGKDIVAMKGPERAKLVCYVPQEQALIFNYTVFDFVLMGRASFISPFSVPSAKDLSRAEESVRFVGLSGFESRPFSQLSSGERRLVMMARALAQESQVLLLDEPTTFLDPKHEAEVMTFCSKLAVEKKKTIVITIHNLDVAVKYADVMVFMKGGRIVEAGKPDQVLKEDLLRSVYDIPMKIVPHDGRIFIVR